MEFQYNKDEKTYFRTKKLKNGYVARIYFYDVKIPNNKLINNTLYGVALAIAKSKKDLNNWIFHNGESRVDDTSQFSEFGISVLIWAKQMIDEFAKEHSNNHSIIIVEASNNKRSRIYKKALKDFKETTYQNKKVLYKKLWEQEVN